MTCRFEVKHKSNYSTLQPGSKHSGCDSKSRPEYPQKTKKTKNFAAL